MVRTVEELSHTCGNYYQFEKYSCDDHLSSSMFFVDVYTSWCGPCRWMSEEVLQTPEAATYFDKHFVCFKIDAEKGDGVEFAKKYDVHAYPTFLMLLPDGTLQHKVVGADTLKLFIPRVERGLKERTSWKCLMEKYEKGTLQKREIPIAIQVFEEAYMKNEVKRLTDSLFQLLSPKEKLNERYWVVYEKLKYGDLFTPRFKFFVENRAKIAGKGQETESFEIIRTMLFD
ncbi:MAG: thioredoxin family protein, partial [Butyricimonas faecihominis]